MFVRFRWVWSNCTRSFKEGAGEEWHCSLSLADAALRAQESTVSQRRSEDFVASVSFFSMKLESRVQDDAKNGSASDVDRHEFRFAPVVRRSSSGYALRPSAFFLPSPIWLLPFFARRCVVSLIRAFPDLRPGAFVKWRAPVGLTFSAHCASLLLALPSSCALVWELQSSTSRRVRFALPGFAALCSRFSS